MVFELPTIWGRTILKLRRHYIGWFLDIYRWTCAYRNLTLLRKQVIVHYILHRFKPPGITKVCGGDEEIAEL